MLGSLRVDRGGAILPVDSAYKPRLVLAALLTRADQATPVDWLVGAVWGDRAPVSARRNVQLYVYRLRVALGGDRIESSTGGYLIRAGDGLDATRFRRLVTEGAVALDRGDTVRASEVLRAALDMWRGPAYAEFLDAPVIADEAARLEQLRLAAYERWAEAELARGHHGAPVDELSALMNTHPYRESLRAYLMRALYGAGRQAEALQLYRDTRQLLNQQLGIEPGPQLQRLHEAMLRRDADLGTADPVVLLIAGAATDRLHDWLAAIRREFADLAPGNRHE